MRAITARETRTVTRLERRFHGSAKPALVFDIDDTLVNTYDYTLSADFGYDPKANQVYIDNAAFPAVFGMTQYKSGTRKHITSEGYAILSYFGDQYSDLLGGETGHKVKIPNPMYYIP